MATEKLNYYVSSLVRKLHSSSLPSVQKALISLTRATKKTENVAKFREEGGIETLLQFIQTSNRKTIDMSVSVLANCALEKESRIEIKRLNGLVHLKNILNSLNETSILSRATRAFANLSLDHTTAQQIVNLDIIPILVKLLNETTDLHFKQNIIRALRVIGKIDDGKKEVVHCNGLQLIIELLHNENKHIRMACLQSLQELSKAGDRLIAEQIQEHCAIEPIIEMTYSEDENLRKIAVLTLSYITANASVRVSVGTIGGIETFIHQIQNRSTPDDLVLASIQGVCMCCREAVNRNKVRSCRGLEVLMEIFRCPEYTKVYDRILGAFVCFIYDELALNRLIANGIIPALVVYLQQLLGPLAGRKVIFGQSESETTPHVLPAKPTITTKSSKSSQFFFQPVLEPASRSERMTCDTITDPPSSVTTSFDHTSALSPTSSLSPSYSPEHHLSYMSPLHLQSGRDDAFSPMVYSPCGSEIDIDDSLEDTISERSPNNEEELSQEDVSRNNEDSHKAIPVSKKDSQSVVLISANDSHNAVPVSGNEQSHNAVSGNKNTLNSVSAHGNKDSHNALSVVGNEGSNQAATASEDTTGESRAQDLEAILDANAVDHFPCRSSEISTFSSVIPLLPGASVSDHFHMFLPKENLFSADLPSPKKSESPVLPKLRRVRRSLSQDAPGGKPGYTPCSPISSLSGQRDGLEKNILFLLSRFAQMPNPPEELIAPSCIQTLMDYLSYSLNPDPRCSRLLGRLTWNVNCFETLVLNMLPGTFYRQLGCGFGPGYHLDNAAESFDAAVEPEANVELSVVNDEESRRMLNERLSTSEDYSASQNTSVRTEGMEIDAAEVQSTSNKLKRTSAFQPCPGSSVKQFTGDSPLTKSPTKSQKRCPNEDADEKIDHVRFSSCRTKEIEELLLSNMSTQACTSFGKGQLAHLLLRGSQKQKRACALSLPYLCRVMSLKRKLLLEYNGILMILSALSDPEEDGDVVRAVESLAYLISRSCLKLPEPIPLWLLFIGKDQDHFSKPAAAQKEDVDCPKKRRKMDACCDNSANHSTGCRYNESAAEPHDVVLKLDSGESIMAHRSVLSAFSEVFSAMLTSDYKEAKQPEVIVKEINYDVLFFLVHYAYGCQRYLPEDASANPTLCALFEKCLPSDPSLANFDFLLDLLVCADRYLLDGLKYQCQQLAIHCVNRERVVDTYLCGVCYNASQLRDFCLKYIFLGKLDLRCVQDCMRRLLESEERASVLEELKRIALSCL